jgi:Uroporphyrinogen-III decarboxylase
MSFADGMSAINLEMPGRIPRTEYSADTNWPLVGAVTGINVTQDSPEKIRRQASQDFMKRWNYDFVWKTLVHGEFLGDFRTRMGHAKYVSGGGDFDNRQFCPFDEPEEVLCFDPFEKYGSIDRKKITKAFEDDYRSHIDSYADAVNMTGIYITLISGLIEIFGWEMLLTAAGIDKDGFGKVANRYAEWVRQYFEALAEADVPVVMIHDDIVWTEGPFLPPAWYRQYVFPNYKKMFSPLLESGKKVIFTSDANYTMFINDIAACGVHGFVMEPTTDMKYVAEKYGKTHVIIGNADTRILLSGDREAIRSEVKRCMDIGKDCPGFFMAVGNHIPPNTPVESALYYNQVYEEMSKR